MRVLATTAALACILAASIPAAAQARTAFIRPDGRAVSMAKLDRDVRRLVRAAKIQGLGVALIENGRVVSLKTYGVANVAQNTPMRPDTVIYAASLTKAAFAYMCMQLVDEGVLDLDKPIGEYLKKPLPDYDNYKDLAGDPRWRKITPRMLLSHTAGFPNYRWINDDKKLNLMFDPGTRYAYSGEGILLMQFVLEEGLGLNVAEEMQRRVFDRFGMRRSSLTWRDDFVGNMADRYDLDGKDLGHPHNMHAHASGSMDSTLSDYAHFLAGVARGDGLSAKAKAEMLTPQITITSRRQFPTQVFDDTDENKAIALSYGLGWGLYRTPWGEAFFKEGHDDGAANYALCVEARHGTRCVLFMSNTVRAEGIYKYLADEILGDTHLPWQWEAYRPYDLTPEAQ
ncbi:MAG TPA: serine hydrolase domain-containing protein [Caulobacteraceae bacterium]|jgi:CubicO group peptidase (beta-lactamase class C family)